MKQLDTAKKRKTLTAMGAGRSTCFRSVNGVITEEGERFSDGCRDYRKRRKVNDEKYFTFFSTSCWSTTAPMENATFECRLLDRFRQQSRELFFENLCSSLYSFVGLCFDERRKIGNFALIY